MIRDIRFPADPAVLATLRPGEMVTISGTIVATAGIPTHQRLVACAAAGEDPPVPLQGGALFHLGSYSRETAEGGFEILYMNPTTSTRFNDVMPGLIRHFGLQAVGGKGGLDRHCAAALAETGGVYLSFLGGGAPIISAGIRAIKAIGYPDMIAHYRLVCLEVENLGPLTVGIDARGGSLYDAADATARDRRDGILEGLRRARAAAPGAAESSPPSPASKEVPKWA